VTGASYDPRRGGLDTELLRLEAQAALSWAEEARLLAELGLRDGSTVLEAGCGPGAVLARLHELLPGARLLAVEPDPELAALARARVPAAEVSVAAAEALPYPDGSVDAIVARYVFQHLADPLVAARELRRVLRPGGLLAAVEVDGQLWGLAEPSFPETAAIHAKVWLAQSGRGGDRMIARKLPRILRRAGFDRIETRLYGYGSDEHSLDAFAPHLDPAQTLARHVEDGTITPAEYGAALAAYRRFRADPDAFVVLAGLVVAGRA
jgi:ubiquinone/menaquinone biosynthesis C-methylase UbiE